MSRCDLYLENYVDHYTGGDTVFGHVSVTFKSEKEVHGISVIIIGEANTQWTEHDSRFNATTKKNVSRLVSYYGSHVFISNETELLGDLTTIAAGFYKYPFRFTLPVKLQSTYKGGGGLIEYKIKAVVKRHKLRFNYEAESPIVIKTPVDLNWNPSLRNPVSRTKTKITDLCSCSRNKGNITVEVKMPQSGIAIGVGLPVFISVWNLSHWKIKEIKCKVKKSIKYTVTSPRHRTRYCNVTIFSDRYSGVGAHGKHTYYKEVLINRASSIANFINCDVIEVNYMLEVTFVLSGMRTNLKIEMPITVGHIALWTTVPDISAISMPMPQVASTASPNYGFANFQAAYNPGLKSAVPVPSTLAGEYPPAFPSTVSNPAADPEAEDPVNRKLSLGWIF